MFLVRSSNLMMMISALRLLIEVAAVCKVSTCCIFLPLSKCALATNTNRCSCTSVLTDDHIRVHVSYDTAKSHRTYRFLHRHPKSLAAGFPSCLVIGTAGKLKLKVVTVSAIRVEQHLFLISWWLSRVIFGNPFQIQISTVLLQFLSIYWQALICHALFL